MYIIVDKILNLAIAQNHGNSQKIRILYCLLSCAKLNLQLSSLEHYEHLNETWLKNISSKSKFSPSINTNIIDESKTWLFVLFLVDRQFFCNFEIQIIPHIIISIKARRRYHIVDYIWTRTTESKFESLLCNVLPTYLIHIRVSIENNSTQD